MTRLDFNKLEVGHNMRENINYSETWLIGISCYVSM